MKVGFYRRSPLDFEPLRVSHFNFQRGYWPTGHGCGANALATLTGIHPRNVSESCQGRNGHFSDKKLISFLRQHGYKLSLIHI
jgi:hypothetical protein